jgi:phosphate:Na+ symporter
MAPEDILERLDAMRWLDRVGYHAWRICYHLSTPATDIASPRDEECHPDD